MKMVEHVLVVFEVVAVAVVATSLFANMNMCADLEPVHTRGHVLSTY